MAKGIYVGVGGVARKVKKAYIGVEGKARKVRKAYIGVGGVARPCWSGGRPAYYGTAAELDTTLSEHAGVSFAGRALFYGGKVDGSNMSGMLYHYDESLTKGSGMAAETDSRRAYGAAAAANENYAIFHGGWNWDRSDGRSAYHAHFDASLTAGFTYASSSGGGTSEGMSGARAGEYALFQGNPSGYSSFAYSASLTTSQPAFLTSPCAYGAATATGGHAVFAGGLYSVTNPTYYATVDAFDGSLTKTQIENLSAARAYLCAATVGGYAVFAGGSVNGQTVDAYDASLTRITGISSLAVARSEARAGTLGEYAMIVGGHSTDQTVELYDASLTHTVDEDFPRAVPRDHAVAPVGDYLLIAGGYADGAGTSTVNVYTV